MIVKELPDFAIFLFFFFFFHQLPRGLQSVKVTKAQKQKSNGGYNKQHKQSRKTASIRKRVPNKTDPSCGKPEANESSSLSSPSSSSTFRKLETAKLESIVESGGLI